MKLRIRMPDDSLALPSLRSWLVQEPEFRGKVTLIAATDNGHLGGVWDAVAIAVGSGGLGAVFLQTLSEWLRHRRPDKTFELTFKDGDREITGTFKNTAPEEARELLRAFDAPDSANRDGDDTT